MKADILSKLKSSAESCYMCPLAETRKKAVFGEGPFDAPAMLVGEAPGADEDELGRPFIGRSGRLLSSLMEEAGLPREKLFITNMVKCRPPENRLPARKELEACRPYLLACCTRKARGIRQAFDDERVPAGSASRIGSFLRGNEESPGLPEQDLFFHGMPHSHKQPV